MVWNDAGPADVPLTNATWIGLVDGLGQPATACAPGSVADSCDMTPIDDRGYNFITRAIDYAHDSDMVVWSTVFRADLRTWNELKARKLRIRVNAPSNKDGPVPDVVSEPLDSSIGLCDPTAARTFCEP